MPGSQHPEHPRIEEVSIRKAPTTKNCWERSAEKVSRRPLIDSRHVGCYRRPWERLAALTSSLGGSSFPLACQWVAQYSTLLCNSSTPTWTMLLVSLKLPEEENIEDEATHRTGSRQQACRNRGKTNKTAGHCSTAAPTHPHTIDLLPMQHCLIAEH